MSLSRDTGAAPAAYRAFTDGDPRRFVGSLAADFVSRRVGVDALACSCRGRNRVLEVVTAGAAVLS